MLSLGAQDRGLTATFYFKKNGSVTSTAKNCASLAVLRLQTRAICITPFYEQETLTFLRVQEKETLAFL